LNELKPNVDLAVPDPYYGSMADFEAVYELLDKATDCVIEKIKDGKIR
jgi:protein-tyrosine phosphatase